VEKVVGAMGAAMHPALIVIGDKLGLYCEMSGTGSLTPGELPARTSTFERYFRDWLNANAASGYVSYDAQTGQRELPDEQVFALTVQDTPGAFHIISACSKYERKTTQAFRTGAGVAGTKTTRTISPAPRGASARTTQPTSRAPGFRRWTAWKRG
jgi:hypothetical protein